MHGAVLLDGAAKVLRPCILWNDSRAGDECGLLERGGSRPWRHSRQSRHAGFHRSEGALGARNEPDISLGSQQCCFPRHGCVSELTGEAIEDMSDASGTLWLDVGARTWSEAALAATGLSLAAMPRLVAGTEPAGRLRRELAARWGMRVPPVLRGRRGRQRRRSRGSRRHSAGKRLRVARHVRRGLGDDGWLPPLSGGRGPRVLPCFARRLASDGRDALRRCLARLVGGITGLGEADLLSDLDRDHRSERGDVLALSVRRADAAQ